MSDSHAPLATATKMLLHAVTHAITVVVTWPQSQEAGSFLFKKKMQLRKESRVLSLVILQRPSTLVSSHETSALYLKTKNQHTAGAQVAPRVSNDSRRPSAEAGLLFPQRKDDGSLHLP